MIPPQIKFSTSGMSGAVLSDCRTYRYGLWRLWEDSTPANRVMFIGLNPSTADESTDDRTIRRCMAFAKQWAFSGMYMMNLYAFRATKPLDMCNAKDPVGPETDVAFKHYLQSAGMIVASWGSLPIRYRSAVAWKSRIDTVRQLIGGKVLRCLAINQDGEPKHPLYVHGATQHIPYNLQPLSRA